MADINNSNEIMFNDLCNDLSDKANEVLLKQCFDPKPWKMLTTLGRKRAVPVEFVIPAFLSVTSHFMNKARIQHDEQMHKFVIFGALLAAPSTGKSPAMNIMEEAAYKLEKWYDIKDECSALSNCGTVEAVIETLKTQGTVLSLFDEASSFLGALGRYNNSGASYDRGIFLQLFNAPKVLNRDLKKEKSRIYDAIYNMLMLGHTSAFIKLLREEIYTKADGLLQRLLFCAPHPLFDITSEEMRLTPQPDVSMVCLLFAIEFICSKEIVFKFDPEAVKYFESNLDNFRQMIKKAYNLDNFIGAMYGKAATHLFRLVGIIAATNKAYNLIENIKNVNKKNLSDEFVNEFRNLINADENNILEEFSIINSHMVQQAIHLLNYFNANRIILAEYKLDINDENLDSCLSEYLDSKLSEKKKKKSEISLTKKKFSEKDLKTMKLIMLFNGDEVYTNVFSEKTRINVSEQLLAFTNLQDLKLGILEDTIAKNNLKVKYFIKANPKEFENNLEKTNNLHLLNIKLHEYAEKYNAAKAKTNTNTTINKESQIKTTLPIISQTKDGSIHEKTLTTEPNSNDQLNISDTDLNRTMIASTPMVAIIEETVTISQNDSILQEINLNNVSNHQNMLDTTPLNNKQQASEPGTSLTSTTKRKLYDLLKALSPKTNENECITTEKNIGKREFPVKKLSCSPKTSPRFATNNYLHKNSSPNKQFYQSSKKKSPKPVRSKKSPKPIKAKKSPKPVKAKKSPKKTASHKKIGEKNLSNNNSPSSTYSSDAI